MILRRVDGGVIKKLGKTSHKKVICKCDDCGNEYDVCYKYAVKNDKNRCPSCRAKEINSRKNVKKINADKQKERWKNLKDRDVVCKNISEGIKKSWKKGRTGKKRISLKDIQKSFNNEGYKLLTSKGEYVSAGKTKLKYKCDNGHISFIRWGNWNRGQRCIYCYGNDPLDIDRVRKSFEDNGYTLLSKDITNAKSDIDFICNNGHNNTITWSNWNSGHRCNKCYKEQKQKEAIKYLGGYDLYYYNVRRITEANYKKYKNIINPKNLERGNNKYHLDHKFSIYEGFKKNIDPEIIASVNNLEMLTECENISKGYSCSITEKELYHLHSVSDAKNSQDKQNISEIQQFLDENEIDYNTELGNFCLWYDHPNGRRSYEIEYVSSIKYPIAYPKYNIEGVDKRYFFDKSYEAEQNNSFKLWIKDFEWNNPNKKEILKSYILHAANKTPYRYYGRDCIVTKVNTKEARDFEEINCFYGKRGASLNLGLRLKKDKNGLKAGTLLMIYTFGKNFFGKNDNVIEVLRVGTRRFSNVVGGASKLLKHFTRNYRFMTIGKHKVKVKYIKFYSDYDHNLGGSLDTLGFEFEGYSKGGFVNYWLESGEVKHREPMHHKAVMKQMEQRKVLAIPNAGVKVFLMTLPDIKEEENEQIIDPDITDILFSSKK